MTDTAEPYYWIPPEPLEHDSCGCGGLCDCNDPAEDVVLSEENDPATGERPGSRQQEASPDAP